MKTEIVKDIRYGNHERHMVDIAFPCGATGDVDLVLMIHGGGWTAGDKSLYHGEIEKFAGSGVVAATMNYRYATESVSCLDILDDITAALAKIKEVALQKGIKISRALLTGLSAGGHLSLLYAYARADEAPIRPAAVIEQSGPADMVSDEAIEKFIYDNEAGGSDEISVFKKGDLFCGSAGHAGDDRCYISAEVDTVFKGLFHVTGPLLQVRSGRRSVLRFLPSLRSDRRLQSCRE